MLAQAEEFQDEDLIERIKEKLVRAESAVQEDKKGQPLGKLYSQAEQHLRYCTAKVETAKKKVEQAEEGLAKARQELEARELDKTKAERVKNQ
eukprot:5619433-Alexandrium_andersonii.AAC.1